MLTKVVHVNVPWANSRRFSRDSGFLGSANLYQLHASPLSLALVYDMPAVLIGRVRCQSLSDYDSFLAHSHK